MPDTGWELAQVNIALPAAQLESDQLAEFVAALDPINATAYTALGWVPQGHRPSVTEDWLCPA